MGTTLLVLSALAGAALGSYAGVVASRGWRGSVVGRSRCDACGRELSWYEVAPLVSYAALRGRCRTCGAGVGLGVLAWEAGGAAFGLALAIPLLASASAGAV